MSRLLFIKEGVAVWSSHLDLMRVLHRSFRRAGLELKHSQGYSPHPELSILMPLSVGVESQCELAEFTLAEGSQVPIETVARRLDPVLPAGVRAIESYEGGQKAGKLAWLRARLTLTYDNPPDSGAEAALAELFARPALVVTKQSKKGPVEVDIAPMQRQTAVTRPGADTLVLETLASAQNPTLNPILLATAVETWLPQYRPDQVRCRRLEVYDADLNIFR